ncbi:fluoride efflux transporter CrcB [bacterium]|nr:fluoride efflux transporter CrcB [bacterium]
MMRNILLVGMGGFIGAVSRYSAGIVIPKFLPSTFPYPTLIVNIVGSFLIGFLMALFLKGQLSESARLFLVVGIMGGLTTFSSFSFETVDLLYKQQIGQAFTNIALNLLLCLSVTTLAYSLFKNS